MHACMHGKQLYASVHLLSFSQPEVTIADGVDGSLTKYIFSYNGFPIPTHQLAQLHSALAVHVSTHSIERWKYSSIQCLWLPEMLRGWEMQAHL